MNNYFQFLNNLSINQFTIGSIQLSSNQFNNQAIQQLISLQLAVFR
jgi:hypothetical protein